MRSTLEKGFKIKWKGGWKPVNLDLHNVVGFYSILMVLLFALTGMYYGITWVNKAMYWSTNWGATLPKRSSVNSDTTKTKDVVTFSGTFDKETHGGMLTQYKDSNYITITYPDKEKKYGTISVYIRNDLDRQYNNHDYSYDQYTGAFPIV